MGKNGLAVWQILYWTLDVFAVAMWKVKGRFDGMMEGRTHNQTEGRTNINRWRCHPLRPGGGTYLTPPEAPKPGHLPVPGPLPPKKGT